MISKNYFLCSLFCIFSVIIGIGCTSLSRRPVVTAEVENDSLIRIEVKHAAHYLIVPVEDAARPLPIYFELEGRRQLLSYIRFAQKRIDYFVPLRIPEDMGDVTLKVVCRSKNPKFLEQLTSSDEFSPKQTLTSLPAYHFTAPFGWMGIPAGAVYDGNQYHLFYESNPNGLFAENFQWSHAVSTGLFDWDVKGTAFLGDSIGLPLGGTCLLDKFNTFGAGNTALIALYTATRGTGDARRQEQCIAFSKDGGDRFEKFVTNPVLRTYDDIPNFRHPGIFRYRRANIWEMVISCGDQMRIYSAEDLGNWNLESYLGKDWGSAQRQYDGAQMVQLKTSDGKQEWVLLCNVSDPVQRSSPYVEYHIGDFDGKTFTPDAGCSGVLDEGSDFFGIMPVDNVNDRCIVLGWLNNNRYAEKLAHKGFYGQLALPRELSLVSDGNRLRVVMAPVKETEALRGTVQNLGAFELNGQKDFKDLLTKTGGAFEMDLSLKNDLRGLTLTLYNPKGEKVTLGVDDKGRLQLSRPPVENMQETMQELSATALSESGAHNLRLFIDRNSIEVFADDGRLVMSQLLVLSSPLSGLSLSKNGTPLTVSSLKVWRLGKEKD